MIGWLRRSLTPPEPPKPRLEARLTQLENQLDDIDARLDYLAGELKKIRGRQFALEKRSQDSPGDTNGNGSAHPHPDAVPLPRHIHPSLTQPLKGPRGNY